MFILLMFFLFKYIDDLIGKGFEWYTIAEVMVYASATNVAMALPLAVLLSSIMTFGNLGENYELVAIKSAGVSLQKAMRPLFILIIGLSLSSFLFMDYMLPKANAKFYSLIFDIRNKKLSFLIKPGVFNNSIPGYAIRVDHKGGVGVDSLYGLLIYDHTSISGIPKIIMAKQGRMTKTSDGKYMILQLSDGIRYEEASGSGIYNPRRTFTRMRFKETEVKLDFSTFGKMSRTEESRLGNNAPMQNLKGLKKREDSLMKNLDSLGKAVKINISSYYKTSNIVKGYTKVKTPAKVIKGSMLDVIPQNALGMALKNGSDLTSSVKQVSNNSISEFDFKTRDVIGNKVEFQRKFTLAFSCLLLFFIGAPLGAIIRKGGLGLPVVIAVFFFLIYHIISTVAEKSAKEGTIDPVLGMWMAVIVLTPLGVFLTYKATVDSALFDLDYYKQLFLGLFKRKRLKV